MLAAQLQTLSVVRTRYRHEIRKRFELGQRVKHGQGEPVAHDHSENDGYQNRYREEEARHCEHESGYGNRR
jgi:hypothetical protein